MDRIVQAMEPLAHSDCWQTFRSFNQDLELMNTWFMELGTIMDEMDVTILKTELYLNFANHPIYGTGSAKHDQQVEKDLHKIVLDVFQCYKKENYMLQPVVILT